TAASELDPHRRVGAMEVPERSGYIDGGYRRNHTDGETASNLPVRLRRLGDRPFSCIETLSCSCQECLSGGGDLNPPAGAREYRRPEFAFDRIGLVVQSVLHLETPLRRASETAFLGHRDHIPHLLKLHTSMISVHY